MRGRRGGESGGLGVREMDWIGEGEDEGMY